MIEEFDYICECKEESLVTKSVNIVYEKKT